MYQNNISELPKLRNENYENIFQVYTNEEGMYFYNILQSIDLTYNLPEGFFSYYYTKYEDTWPLISYKVYQTPNLWWLILPFNNIINPTAKLENGIKLKVLKPEYVRDVLNQISTQQT